MGTWATVAVAAGSSALTTLAVHAVRAWREHRMLIREMEEMGPRLRAQVAAIRAAWPRPDVDRCASGPHVCHNGRLRPICRESCSMCSGTEARACFASHEGA